MRKQPPVRSPPHMAFFITIRTTISTVLRMLSSYVGEERFMKGVSLYLKKHQYKNTVTKDLWAGIQAATGLDIGNMMNSWITQMGYPVVAVTEKEGGIHIRQDRFLETGPPDEKENQTIWCASLRFLGCTTVRANSFIHLLHSTQGSASESPHCL